MTDIRRSRSWQWWWPTRWLRAHARGLVADLLWRLTTEAPFSELPARRQSLPDAAHVSGSKRPSVASALCSGEELIPRWSRSWQWSWPTRWLRGHAHGRVADLLWKLTTKAPFDV